MDITLQYFDGCPSWRLADERLHVALERTGLAGSVVHYEIVDTPEKAAARNFHGSPTILIDGIDPFAGEGAAVGLSCRLFATEEGPAGAPTVEQLVAVLVRRPE